jgi:hypothetical protein
MTSQKIRMPHGVKVFGSLTKKKPPMSFRQTFKTENKKN